MPSLRELQAGVRLALLDDGAPAVAEVLGDGLAPAARLQLYRNHVFATLTAVLEATYPVVCRLVDARFFAYAADRYIRAHPPDAPCLFEYGASFPEFLSAFPPCRELPYLPDVARLEWAMNVALTAENAEALDPARLAGVPPAEAARFAFRLHPSLSLLASPWPVDRIWTAHQGDDEAVAPVDVDAGGVRLEIRRRGDDVIVRRLDDPEYRFLCALAGGRPLEAAAAAALASDAGFDLSAALSLLLGEGVIIDFMHDEETT